MVDTSAAFVAAERQALERMLDAQRVAIAQVTDGLDETSARRRLVPSRTTPIALLAHACFVEKVWFQHRVAGLSRQQVGIGESVDETFLVADEVTCEELKQEFRRSCERSRQIAAEHELDEQFDWRLGQVTLRYIYLHLIAEYARHAGHADILREQIGAVGPA